MAKTVTIDPRFNGPPGSGNGGYLCGLLAQELAGACETTLRAPPPLDTALSLSRDGGRVMLRDGETLLAEARAASLSLAAPAPPTLADARAAEARYLGHRDHRYPTCFVCGPGRPAHDGLDLFTGAVAGRDMVASTWTPAPDLAGADGRVDHIFLHAALDCPSYWALPHAGKPALLARMTSQIDAPAPRIGEPLIVIGWPLGADGRKHRGASALYSADGALLARAEALWIEPKA